MIKCYAPWTNLDVDYQGTMKPCCKFSTDKYDDPLYDLIDGDFEKYLNSPMLESVKDDLMNNRWPAGCQRCMDAESNNITSKRLRDHVDFADSHQSVDFAGPSQILSITTELGISCNLACIICNHTYSTGWHPETKEIYNIVPASTSYTKADLRVKALTLLPSIQHLDLIGGEPLTTNFKEHKFLLDHYISKGDSSQMTLRYHTNGTVWPSKELWTRWEHFKLIDITFSIDGVGDAFEYTRWPGKWEDFESNAKKYCELRDTGKNIKISAQIAASAYNCMCLDDIYGWCYQHQITDVYLNRVLNPQHLQINVWPDSVRKTISAHMTNSNIKDIAILGKWLLSAPAVEKFEEFIEYTETHNQYRKVTVGMCGAQISDLYSNKRELLYEDRTNWWRSFYNTVKDASWPDCPSEQLINLLPEVIQSELYELHNYQPSPWFDPGCVASGKISNPILAYKNVHDLT